MTDVSRARVDLERAEVMLQWHPMQLRELVERYSAALLAIVGLPPLGRHPRWACPCCSWSLEEGHHADCAWIVAARALEIAC